MASPSPSNDPPTQVEYYTIRDTLFGRNGVNQDVKLALELASTCQHPDAQWLTEIFSGKDVKTKEEAREVFLARGNNDARALCFAAVIAAPLDMAASLDMSLLRRSAELGFALAQALIAGGSNS